MDELEFDLVDNTFLDDSIVRVFYDIVPSLLSDEKASAGGVAPVVEHRSLAEGYEVVANDLAVVLEGILRNLIDAVASLCNAIHYDDDLRELLQLLCYCLTSLVANRLQLLNDIQHKPSEIVVFLQVEPTVLNWDPLLDLATWLVVVVLHKLVWLWKLEVTLELVQKLVKQAFKVDLFSQVLLDLRNDILVFAKVKSEVLVDLPLEIEELLYVVL